MTGTALPSDLLAALARMGLWTAPEPAPWGTPLEGGVSSDIWRVCLADGVTICLKRALPRLRVAALWEAPVDRNLYEARWMRRAEAAAPGSAPALLGQDTAAGCLAMAFMPPETHRLWKTELHAGRADPGFAAQVGAALARIHATTAASAGAVAAAFPTDAIFHAIRLDPYLLATAEKHPDRADSLRALVAATITNKRALVHGDASPKNILVGPGGPVFLDAECAWWGDPAFDAAFCLNHLLLKCLWTPHATEGFLACFGRLAAAWGDGVDWEPRAAALSRVARLLPGLLLARVDGKSPVEYIVTEAARSHVRRVARAFLAAPVDTPEDVAAAWRLEVLEGMMQR